MGPSPSLSMYVCAACKQRKRRCDKLLPQCTFCKTRGLDCRYTLPLSISRRCGRLDVGSDNSEPLADVVDHFERLPATSLTRSEDQSRRLLASLSTLPSTVSGENATNPSAAICHELSELMRCLGQFADELSHSYFTGLHMWLPFMSRGAFNAKMVNFPASQDANFGFLLLCVCLAARRTASAQLVPQQELYMAARSTMVRLQTISGDVAYDLIRGCIVLAEYEYACQRPEIALATLTTAIRLGYSIRLNEIDVPSHADEGGRRSSQDFIERNNLWWMLVICERVFLMECRNVCQPLLTPFPPPTSRPLPEDIKYKTKRGMQPHPPPLMSFENVTNFGRAAQASKIFDQVLSTVQKWKNRDASFENVDRLDMDLQSFLSVLLEQARAHGGGYCGAIAMSLKAMFSLHTSLLLEKHSAGLRTISPTESQAALNTATNIMLDIVISAQDPADPLSVDMMPPTCSYNVDTALRIIAKTGGNPEAMSRGVNNAFESFLCNYKARWKYTGLEGDSA